MDGLLHDLHNWWRSLKRFAATVLIYVVVEFDLLTALSILPTFITVLIPNRILIIIDKAVQLILTPWYGWPGWPRPCGLGPCVCFSNVNLAFGTYEYNVPAAVARVFGAGVNPNWHTETAHFLCALSKIVYEEFIDAPVCQDLLRKLSPVQANNRATLVAGYDFLRIEHAHAPPDGENLQSIQVAVIQVVHGLDTDYVIAFRGSEPFVQADWFMDFDFILSDQAFGDPAPKYGNMHRGFRLGLGLDLDLLDLSAVNTQYRSITYFAGAGPQRFAGWRRHSAFDILANGLASAIGGAAKTRVFVTGHSLGGGVAHLFAIALMLRNPKGLGARLASVYTFAQPRIGDADFAAISDRVLAGKHFRAVDAIDIVPRVPPLRVPPRFPRLLTWFEQHVLGRHIVGYCHSGQARQGDQVVLASAPGFAGAVGTQLPVDININAAQMDPVDHTNPGPVEPAPLTIPRLLYYGLGKILWGAVCLLLGPVQFVVRWINFLAPAQYVTLHPRLQTPAETMPRLAFRIVPFLWPISDHFMGSYLNMYYSQQCSGIFL